MTVEDDRRDYGEPRFITIGFLEERMVALVWTLRHGAMRVISLRKCNDREQAAHGDRLR
ncbi:BrnT family toxin [Methylosinus sporium]|uniref:BrnT family toxin n=1 Tax=Methylosinus sporium TaxID=428 RepID=UPI00383AEEE7